MIPKSARGCAPGRKRPLVRQRFESQVVLRSNRGRFGTVPVALAAPAPELDPTFVAPCAGSIPWSRLSRCPPTIRKSHRSPVGHHRAVDSGSPLDRGYQRGARVQGLAALQRNHHGAAVGRDDGRTKLQAGSPVTAPSEMAREGSGRRQIGPPASIGSSGRRALRRIRGPPGGSFSQFCRPPPRDSGECRGTGPRRPFFPE